MTRAKQFVALAELASLELFRQPAVFLLIICNCACTILVPLAVSHQLGQTSHLAMDSSLAFELVSGIILSGYAACATLHNECRSGTILVVFSKPVGRLMFFLAKGSAVALVLVYFVVCSSLSSLLAQRLAPRNFEYDALGVGLLLATPFVAFVPAALLNFFRHRPFVPHALTFFGITLSAWVLLLGMTDPDGHRVAFGSSMEWRILPACLLEGLALLIMACIALSLAARLSTPATVAILAVILFAGLITDHLVTLLPDSQALRTGLRVILPDIQAFWPADRLAGGGAVTASLISHASVYATAYAAGILSLGYAAFRNRQF